jgi:hypothetical protein
LSKAGKCTRTHFDFLLVFEDGFQLILELDGDQHFYEAHGMFSHDGCARDLLKEQWAVRVKKIRIVRLLQTDVWNDTHRWKRWLRKSVQQARNEPGVLTPIVPDRDQYKNVETSVYAQLRQIESKSERE